MIAPDRPFLRRLRSRVRAEVKASPGLRRERKRTRVGWQHRHYAWDKLRVVVPIVLLGAMLAGAPFERVTPLLVVWSAIVVLHRAAQLAATMHDPAHLWMFYHQPLGNAEVFRHQWSVVLRSSLWLGVDWLVFTFAAAAQSHSLVAACVAPLFAFAQWATAFAIAATLVRCWPRLPYAAFATVLYVGTFIVFQVAGSRVLPVFGWLTQVLATVTRSGMPALLGSIGIGLGAAALLRWHWRAWRDAFNLERVFEYDSANPAGGGDDLRWIPAEASADQSAPFNDEPLPEAKPPAPVDLPKVKAALEHALDQPSGLALYQRGHMERYLTRLLSSRLRAVADFLQPYGFGWSRGWLIGLAFIVLARLLQLLGISSDATLFVAVGGVGLFAMPLFGSAWYGLGAIDVYQTRIAIVSFFPVTFWEVSRLLLSVTVLRCLAAFPLLVLAVHFGAAPASMAWSESAGWALRGMVAVLALQPLWVIGAFSKNSNDTSARGWFTALLGVTLVLGIIFVIVTGLMLFVAESAGVASIAAAVLLSCMFGALLFYGWAYNRGMFDLIGRPPAR